MCVCVGAHVLLYVFVFVSVCAFVCSTHWGAMPRCRGLCCERRAMSQACGNKPSFSPLSPTLSHSSHPVCLYFTPVGGEVACSEHRRGKTRTHVCKGHQTLRKRMCVHVCVYVCLRVCAYMCVDFSSTWTPCLSGLMYFFKIDIRGKMKKMQINSSPAHIAAILYSIWANVKPLLCIWISLFCC